MDEADNNQIQAQATSDADYYRQMLVDIISDGDNYSALAYVGDTVTHVGDTPWVEDDEVYETVHREEQDRRRWNTIIRVITKTPDGKLYEWFYEDGNTEMQEPIGPGEYGTPTVTEVERVEVVAYEYRAKKSPLD